MSEQRPNPDSLLNVISNDRSISSRGRLKIFFGASAGVGKTYAMLQEAQRKFRDDIDVVIGIVETHGRDETAQLVKNIPYIRTQQIEHRGILLQEFDLEAALNRKPSLILVDELAHTNAPGTRHLKRWQDVEELLNNGIDVYTTLNVQHLESINDQVSRLTGIVVRETVADSIFDEANEVALIDLPSDELLKRLHDGKVYIAPGANQRAAEHFFKKSNLVALRELALRRTAERVDAENDVLLASQGHKEAQIAQKILVCIGHDAVSPSVIRHARRMASRAKSPWFAVYVETQRHQQLTEHSKHLVERNLRLAETIGARIVRLYGNNACEEILNYARDNGITRIVVGHRHRSRFARIFRNNLSKELVESASGMEITTVTDSFPLENAYQPSWIYHISKPTSYFHAFLFIAFATIIGFPFRELTDSDNLTMIYLTSVVAAAAKLGTGPSIFASILSVLFFNFFFTKPYYTLEFYDQGYYITFTVMLITSLIVGSLAARLSHQARQSRKREHETNIFYSLTRELGTLRNSRTIAEAAINHIEKAFDSDATIFLPTKEGFLIIPQTSAANELKEESVARWTLESKQLAGRQTDTLPSAKGLYLPLIAESTALGVLGIIPRNETRNLTVSEISQLETFSSLIASTLQRTFNAEDAEQAKIDSEREKMRNTLLSSVSHDLRTPLTSITGAATSALLFEADMPEHLRDLITSIHTQSERLAKLVSNLLDVTSLESGKFKLNTQPYYITEVIGSALKRIENYKAQHQIQIHITPHLPLVLIDGLLIEQVIINLLDNALRFTDNNGTIQINVHLDHASLCITISDNGAGIPPGDELRIFDKFYTKGSSSSSHAGLGLAICKGIIELHGGTITAYNNIEGGASFSFTLPNLVSEILAHD